MRVGTRAARVGPRRTCWDPPRVPNKIREVGKAGGKGKVLGVSKYCKIKSVKTLLHVGITMKKSAEVVIKITWYFNNFKYFYLNRVYIKSQLSKTHSGK